MASTTSSPRCHGSVVSIASAAGLVGVARQTDYSAGKWAAVGFTESLRQELRADGHPVHTLAVCPYYIDTGMFAGRGPDSPPTSPGAPHPAPPGVLGRGGEADPSAAGEGRQHVHE